MFEKVLAGLRDALLPHALNKAAVHGLIYAERATFFLSLFFTVEYVYIRVCIQICQLSVFIVIMSLSFTLYSSLSLSLSLFVFYSDCPSLGLCLCLSLSLCLCFSLSLYLYLSLSLSLSLSFFLAGLSKHAKCSVDQRDTWAKGITDHWMSMASSSHISGCAPELYMIQLFLGHVRVHDG